jgi:hypothetical protein
MKRLIIIGLIALSMLGLFAANQTMLLASSPSTAPIEKMLTANQLYDNGHYVQAAQAYQQLVDQGVVDGALYYNLGNAYHRQGDYGRAILNYHHAQHLLPRDPDIEANLALARTQAVDQFEAAEDNGLLSGLGGAVQSWFTLNELAMAALGAWILLVFLVMLFGSAKPGSGWRRSLQYALVIVGIVFVVGLLALGSSLYLEHDRSEGVIVAAEVDVASGPGAQYVAEFTLHNGAEVHLLEVRSNWVRLALPGDGLEGWVPASAVEALGG